MRRLAVWIVALKYWQWALAALTLTLAAELDHSLLLAAISALCSLIALPVALRDLLKRP